MLIDPAPGGLMLNVTGGYWRVNTAVIVPGPLMFAVVENE